MILVAAAIATPASRADDIRSLQEALAGQNYVIVQRVDDAGGTTLRIIRLPRTATTPALVPPPSPDACEGALLGCLFDGDDCVIAPRCSEYPALGDYYELLPEFTTPQRNSNSTPIAGSNGSQ